MRLPLIVFAALMLVILLTPGPKETIPAPEDFTERENITSFVWFIPEDKFTVEHTEKSLEASAKVVPKPKPTTIVSRGTPKPSGQAFVATFYTAFCDTGCIGITATGLDVRNTIYTSDGFRVIAVDPTVIPLGSLVQVTLNDGTVFNAVAEDTGGAIKGRIIDVLVKDRTEAFKLGRQNIRVHVLRWGR